MTRPFFLETYRKRRRLTAATLLLAISACADNDDRPAPKPLANIMDAKAWQIGPVIETREGYINASQGVSRSPTALPVGWQFKFPLHPGHVNYVTVPTGSLAGKTQVRLSFRVEGEPGVELRGKSCPDRPSSVYVYLQRRGDDWSGRGEMEQYRWWASFAPIRLTGPGEYEAVVPFSGRWTAVMGSDSITGRAGFRAALANVERIGFTFADCTGLGHGAYATAPATFVLTRFAIE